MMAVLQGCRCCHLQSTGPQRCRGRMKRLDRSTPPLAWLLPPHQLPGAHFFAIVAGVVAELIAVAVYLPCVWKASSSTADATVVAIQLEIKKFSFAPPRQLGVSGVLRSGGQSVEMCTHGSGSAWATAQEPSNSSGSSPARPAQSRRRTHSLGAAQVQFPSNAPSYDHMRAAIATKVVMIQERLRA